MLLLVEHHDHDLAWQLALDFLLVTCSLALSFSFKRSGSRLRYPSHRDYKPARWLGGN